MTIRVYSNDQIPFSVSEDWSHSMGFLCSTTNQCSELICLQYSVVVSMNKTNLIIKVAAGGFANGNKWDRTAKMKLDSTVALVTPKWLPSNNDRQGPWTKRKSNAVKKKKKKNKAVPYAGLNMCYNLGSILKKANINVAVLKHTISNAQVALVEATWY